MLGLQHDVTDQVLAAQHLQDPAHQDPLPRLANQRQLEQHMSMALARADRAGTAVAVLSLDLDGFEANDARPRRRRPAAAAAAAAGRCTTAARRPQH